MKISRRFISLAFVGAAVPAFAQNPQLNPTVQVTNEYRKEFTDMDKNRENVFIPDSLYRFDLNFDYGGFETPYAGQSEFNPYFTDLELESRNFDGKKLYLKAGAGYSLAPVLDFAYTAKSGGVFKLGLHANGDAYYGRHDVLATEGTMVLPQKGSWWKGYDAKASGGIDGRFDFNNWSMYMIADYEGAFGKSAPSGLYARRMYNGAYASIGFDANPKKDRKFDIKGDLSYAYGIDDVASSLFVNGLERSVEHNASARLQMSMKLRKGGYFEIEGKTKFALNTMEGKARLSSTTILNPRYRYSRDRFDLSAGASIMVDYLKNVCGFSAPFTAWPSLELQYAAIKDHLDLYANASLDGGLYGAREDALENRFYIRDEQLSNLRRYDLNLGLRGNIAMKLDYDLRGGFAMAQNDPLFYVGDGDLIRTTDLMIVHRDTYHCYAQADIKGRFGAFSFDAAAKYRHYFISENEKAGGLPYSCPPALTASLNVKYDIINRIGISVGASYRSSYKAGCYSTPFIVDLHASADYRLNKRVSFFLKGENLLNRSLQYIPLYARHGVCVTAGAVLNL